MAILNNIGDFLSRNASTIGGVLGGIGGELVDPFGGGVAGAALGSGLGKAVQNASQGQSAFQGSDITAGLEGGAGQALGYGALAGAGKLLGGVASKIAPKVADTGISNVLQKVTPSSLKRLGNASGINPTLETANRLGIIGSSDPTQLSLDDIEKMSSRGLPNVATGADGIISSTRDAVASKALDESGRTVDLDQVRNMANDVAQKHGLASDLTTQGAGGLPRQQGAGANAANYALSVIRRAPSTIEGVNNLLKEADSLPSTNPLKGYYNEVAKNVHSEIFDSPEVKQAISNYKTTPEDKQAILKDTGGNQEFANYITDTLDNATSNLDLAKAHSDLINVRALGDVAKQISDNTVQKAATTPEADLTGLKAAGHVITGNPLAAAKTVGSKVLQSPEGAGKVSKIAQQSGNILNRIARFTGPATAGTALAASTAAQQPGMQDAANVMPQGGSMAPQPAPGGQPGSLLSGIENLAVLDPMQYGSMAQSLLPGIQKAAAATPVLGAATAAMGQPGVSGNPIDLILAKIPGTAQWRAAQLAQAASHMLGVPNVYSPLASPGANAATGTALSQIPGAIGY